MPQTYQGKPVKSVRDARKGDPSFREGEDQVVITLADGTEKTVRRSEVEGKADPPANPAPGTGAR